MATLGEGSGNGDGNPATNLNTNLNTNPSTRGPRTPGNPRGYPPFKLDDVPSYSNQQIRYYYKTGAAATVDQQRFHQLLEHRRISLDLIGWDGNSDIEQDQPDASVTSTIRTDASIFLSYDDDDEPDSDCPDSQPGHKGIKFNAADITKLKYNSDVARYRNWLTDLQSAFDGDPARFPESRQKVIFATITLDEQLKTTYNSVILVHPAISHHWRKFTRWVKETVLQDSKQSKLSTDFM